MFDTELDARDSFPTRCLFAESALQQSSMDYEVFPHGPTRSHVNPFGKLRNPSCEVHCLNWLCQEAKEAGRLARRARTAWLTLTHGATEVTKVIEITELTEVTEVTTSNPKASLETRHNFSLWHLVAAVAGQ